MQALKKCQITEIPFSINLAIRGIAITGFLSSAVASFFSASQTHETAPGLATFYSLIGISCCALTVNFCLTPLQIIQPMLSAATLSLAGYSFMIAIDQLSSAYFIGYVMGPLLLALSVKGFWQTAKELHQAHNQTTVVLEEDGIPNQNNSRCSCPAPLNIFGRLLAIMGLIAGIVLAAHKAHSSPGSRAFYAFVIMSCITQAIAISRVPLDAPEYAFIPTMSSATLALSAAALAEALYSPTPLYCGLSWASFAGLVALSGAGFVQSERKIRAYHNTAHTLSRGPALLDAYDAADSGTEHTSKSPV